MSVKEIEMKIAKLEAQISENIGDLESMRRELNRLKLQAFEEDLRESGEKQLLQGQCCFNTTVEVDLYYHQCTMVVWKL